MHKTFWTSGKPVITVELPVYNQRNCTARQFDAVVVDVKQVVDFCLIRSAKFNVNFIDKT